MTRKISSLEKLKLSENLTIAPLLSCFPGREKRCLVINPKLDIVNDEMTKLKSIKGYNSIQNLVRSCQFILKILSGNEILSIKGCNSFKIFQKWTGNNTKVNLVNVDVHTKFGLILSIHS